MRWPWRIGKRLQTTVSEAQEPLFSHVYSDVLKSIALERVGILLHLTMA